MKQMCVVVRPSEIRALRKAQRANREPLSKAQIRRLRTEKAMVMGKYGKLVVIKYKSDKIPWYVARKGVKLVSC